MYKLHLILKYLRKRRIAWVSLIAVMLCTAMVLVVISVMGGWLATFRESFHGMSGDVVVRGEPLTGFARYEEMIEAVKKLPEVKDASPVLRTFGLINIRNKHRRGVQVMGLAPNVRNVNTFAASLYKRPNASDLFALYPDIDYNNRIYLPRRFEGDARQWPGMIVGTGVVGIRKNEEGELQRSLGNDEYKYWVRLSVLPLSPYTASLDLTETATQEFWIVDDSHTQVYFYDSDTVYVPFDVLQKMLKMAERPYEDASTGEKRTEPARTSDVQIGLKSSADLDQAKKKILAAINEVRWSRVSPRDREQLQAIVREQAAKAAREKRLSFQQQADLVETLSEEQLNDWTGSPLHVLTWRETNAKFLGAVENEKILLLFLFGIISIVAVFLIFCIFYMIVVEKTRDIGIIKSVGATRGGVAGIFLGYGGAIGIVGAGLGWLIGYLIVHNINEIHTWLGKALGIQVWNPEVYMFDRIPNRMDPAEVLIIMAVAIIASVIGALVPAIRAARMHPVEALRWE